MDTEMDWRRRNIYVEGAGLGQRGYLQCWTTGHSRGPTLPGTRQTHIRLLEIEGRRGEKQGRKTADPIRLLK